MAEILGEFWIFDRMNALEVQVASTREITLSEGPGARFAIWVQGCSLKCEGCFNPHFWGKKGGSKVTVDALLKQVLSARKRNPQIEGVTFLGGEPFEQAEPLARLAKNLQMNNLTTMVFSGYTLDELLDTKSRDYRARKEFLESIDLLVDGRYEKQNPDLQRPWVGSKNQTFHFLTDRYSHATLFEDTRDSLEITVFSSGLLQVNGWASSAQLENMLEGL